MLFATTGYVLLPSSVVWANPSGEQVVGGAATFHRDGNNLTVNQTTDRLAVNWQDFSIAAGERTHFNMPSAASVALNRVLGGNPSQIYGTLSSNGNIILVNNAGIFVGPGGMVNAASFVGSTLDIDPEQFMNGSAAQGLNLHGNSYAPIVNQGNIRAEKGDVFLIAHKVENRGTISAPSGRVGLVGVGAAADRTEVVLHEVGGSGFAVRVAQLDGSAARGDRGELPDGEELLNEGEIAAAQAELSASGNIYALAIKNSGTIRAAAVVANADGTVRLDGGRGDVLNTGTLVAKNAGDEATAAGGQIEVTGQNVTASPESIITAAGGAQGGDGGRVKLDAQETTIVQGTVDVAAPSAGAKGGKVELLGERVGLFEGAKVDASGGAGGGTVLAGGDYLGGRMPAESLRGLVQLEDGPVKNAKATVMASTAEIRADATASGDGGKIILWSDEYTGFYGQLFARGGRDAGDGGFIETSSYLNLAVSGMSWAQAPNGQAGVWLLDPLNVVISDTTQNADPTLTPNLETWNPSGAGLPVSIDGNAINTALSSGINVTVTTAGSFVGPIDAINEDGILTVNFALSDFGGGGSLTLTADGNLVIAAPISLTTGLFTGTSVGGQIVATANLSTTSGAINLNADGSVTAANLATDTGNISVTSTTDQILVNGAILTNFGEIQMVAANGSVTASSDISILNTGNLRVTAGTTVTAAGVVTVQNGDVLLSAGTGMQLNRLTQVTVGNIELVTAAGNITTSGGLTANDGFISLVASGGNITNSGNIQGDITDSGVVSEDPSILLSATGFILNNGNISTATGDNSRINLSTTSGAITQNGNLTTRGSEIRVNSGGSVSAFGNISTVVGGADGNLVEITANGDNNAGGTITAGVGRVYLRANGNLNSSVTINTTSGRVELSAGGNTSSGGSITTTLAGGRVELTADGGVTLNSSINAALASVELRARDNSTTVNSTIFSGLDDGSRSIFLFSDNQDVTINSAVTTVGNIALEAQRSVNLNSLLDVSGASSPGAAVGGVFIFADDASFSGGGGLIRLASIDDAPLGGLRFDAGQDVTARLFLPTFSGFSLTAGADWTGGDGLIGTQVGPPIAAVAGRNIDIQNVFFVAGATEAQTFVVGNYGAVQGINSGGIIFLNANGAVLVMGDQIRAPGAFTAQSNEGTSGIIFNRTSTRTGPIVVAGSQEYRGRVTLNTEGQTVLQSTAGGPIFRSTLNDGSVNTAPAPTAGDPVALQKHIHPTGLEELLLVNAGNGQFEGGDVANPKTRQEALVGTALVPEEKDPVTDAITSFAYLSLGPLYKFRSEGGSLNFQATATAAEPTVDGVAQIDPITGIRYWAPLADNVTGPSIYVLDVPNTRLAGSGSVTFDNTALIITADSYFTSQADMLLGGAITGANNSPDNAALFNAETILYKNDDYTGDTSASPNGGQIIIASTLGTAALPLGAVRVVARGIRPEVIDPLLGVVTSQKKDSQISVLGGVVTFPGTNPLKPGTNGSVVLAADGSVVLNGIISLRFGESLAGDFTVKSNLNASGSDENIQFDSGTRVTSRGGKVFLNGDTFFAGTVAIDTTNGNAAGDITFGGKVDGTATLNISAGIASLTFSGLVGSLNPVGLNVGNSGGIAFNSNVIMGGAFNLGAENLDGEAVSFLGSIEGNQALTINSRNGDIRFAGNIGKATPISSLNVLEGVTGQIIFEGQQIRMQGAGGLTLSKPTILGTSGPDTFTIETNALQNVAGGDIRFNREVSPGQDGMSLVLNAGTGGRVFFGEGLGKLGADQKSPDPAGLQFGKLRVVNGSAVEMADGYTVYARGTYVPDPNEPSNPYAIDLGAPVTTASARSTLTFKAGLRDIRLSRGGFLAGVREGVANNSAGANLNLLADDGNIISIGTMNVSGGDNDSFLGGSGFDSGSVNFTALNGVIEVDSIQANGGSASQIGQGGGGRQGLAGTAIELKAKNILVKGGLISNGGDGITGLGGNGGEISLNLVGTPNALADGVVWNTTRESFTVGSIYAEGGNSSAETGGRGGSVTITAEQGFLIAPTSFNLAGGTGRDSDPLLAGNGGNVLIKTQGAAGDIFFANNQFEVTGDGGLEISAGRNLVFINREYLVDLNDAGEVVGYNESTDRLDLGGVVLTMNSVLNPDTQALPAGRRGEAKLNFSTAANGNYAYGKDAQGNPLLAGLYVPSNGYIIANGGAVTINGGKAATFAGNAVLSGITTTSDDSNGGRITIVNQVVGTLGNVEVKSSLETFGGTPVLPTYGRNGGLVSITGRDVILNRIDTRGSASLATANTPAIGGSGGNIQVTSSGGGTITLRRDLLAGGGQGLGTRDATGGSGGNIFFTGNLTLNTGDSTRTTVTINTLGGEGRLDGEPGQGGDISWSGGATAATLQGTTGTSTTLALNYGSGSVTLGNNNDLISLKTLVTAGDNVRSTGSLVINSKLQLDTLTTFARGYSIEIRGDADPLFDSTIVNAVNFLNTGTVWLGADGRKLTFTGGFDTLTGSTVGGVNVLPAQTILAGELVTGSGTGAGMTTGLTVLAANTSLNSNGNAIEIGQLDGTGLGGQNLTLLAGIGSGSVTFNTTVGASVRLGTVAIEGAATNPDPTEQSTTSVTFKEGLTADILTSGTHSLVTLEGDANIADTATLEGVTVLNNVTAGAELRFATGAGGVSTIGEIQLKEVEGALGVRFVAQDELQFTQAVAGQVNLILGGDGLKDFLGSVSVGTGTGASVQLNEGSAQFLSLTTASGITSSVGTTATFGGKVTLASGDNTQTDLNGVVRLGSILDPTQTIIFESNSTDSAKPVRFDGTVLLVGNAALSGSGFYRIGGNVEGNGGVRDLDLSGSGQKTFVGTVGVGGLIGSINQADNSGRVIFSDDVITQGPSSFAGNVTLGALQFTAGGITTFGSAGGGDTLTLAGNAELAGIYDVNSTLAGAGNDLTLSSAGLKQFDGAVSGLGTLSLVAGVATFNSTLGTTSSRIANLLQTGGTLNLNGNANVSSASLLTANLGTINFANTGLTTIGGTLTTTGSTGMTSGAGFTLATGNSILANGNLSLTGLVTLTDAATFGGTGSLTLNSGVVGNQLLSLSGGRQIFVGAVDVASFDQLAGGTAEFRQNVLTDGGDSFLGAVVLAGSQFTSGGGSNFNTVSATGASGITTAADLTLAGLLTLGSSLQLTDGGGAAVTSLSAISGSSANLEVTTDNILLGGAVSLGSGKATINKANNGVITVGGVAGFVTAADLARFTTSGGLDIKTDGDINLDDLTTVQTAGITGPLGLVSRLGDLGIVGTVSLNSLGGSYNNLNIFGALDTGGFRNLTLRTGSLTYNNAPRSLSLAGVQTAGGIDVSTVGSMALSGAITAIGGNVQLASGSGMSSSASISAANNAQLSSGGSLSSSGTLVSGGSTVLLAGGGLNQSGAITAQGGSVGILSGGNLASSASVSAGDTLAMSASGDITMGASYSGRQILLDPSGNLTANGARFQSGDIRARTKDFFANYPNSAAIPGLSVVVGVTSLSQLGPNQIGIELPLLAGAGGPFITEFTTGTGQPYILATQNAVPMVMSPTAIQFASALTPRVRYTQEELEMMTPEERAALEASRRQTAARVILQKETGEEQEIGLPADGEIPQAKVPEKEKPAPTAQVYLHGKPLADKADKEKSDSTQLLRLRPSRSVALRPENEARDLMEGERLAAEVNTVSIPLAGK